MVVKPALEPMKVLSIPSVILAPALSPTKVIYVSCNPSTQARDVKIMIENKYKIIDIQPIDMFPHTPHIECIITLKK